MKRTLIFRSGVLILLAILVSILQMHLINEKSQTSTIPYPIAALEISVGQAIDESHLEWIEVERKNHGSAPLSKRVILGKYAKSNIPKGQIIYSDDLMEESFEIPKGHRVISVNMSADDLCNLHIEPGMLIDLSLVDNNGIQILEDIKILDIEKEGKGGAAASLLILGKTSQIKAVCVGEDFAKMEVLMKAQ